MIAKVMANVGGIEIGDEQPLVLIAGPCVIESEELCLEVGTKVKAITQSLGIPYIFKASFDKANRTSVKSFRGPGIDRGLEILSSIRSRLDVPVLTDIHEPWQAKPAAEVVDVLQIPAFLCRQTDLIVAAAETGKCVNIKKAQFLAAWDMKNSVEKAKSTGNANITLTERGNSFGYNMLVVDMCGLPVMRSLGCPVVFDATHSVQRPGGLGDASGGAREYVPHLIRAAVAVGVDALFLEVHPNPLQALCDAASMLDLADLPKTLADALAIRKAINTH
ncbi:MAG: 3-deoxy-8-phosphooctulonate synthase [Armatimonadetes bacterium]|nr:3-deoxy-8-phosphooctulonate synthase [Armatimonadota bacterium]